MKTLRIALLFLTITFTFYSCQDNDDVAAPSNLEIQNFIWKGLNTYYFWQSSVPNLADNKFKNQTSLNNFLKNYSYPEELFKSLLVNEKVDRFSWIVSDYVALEQSFQGIVKSDGVEFGLTFKPNSNTDIYGWVRYIVPGSDAAKKGMKRGDLFMGVNGTQLTVDNYKSLLFGSNDTYTINLAEYNGTTIVGNGKNISLIKTVLDENPIAISKTIDSNGHKIGYLMYNGFYSDYDTELNTAFGNLKGNQVTDLVLDLRYNSGGSIRSAIYLASMITGQFTGQIFAKQQWNEKIQSYFNSNNKKILENYFTDKIGSTPINSLNLKKIYILTTKSSASASELLINCLKPYIEVVQIGDTTTGKNVGSITLYDSPDFTKDEVNPNHKYAMQPIVLKLTNKDGFGDYEQGIVPNYSKKEDTANLGELGKDTEPLLALAIEKITGKTRLFTSKREIQSNYFTDSKSRNKYQNQMYLDLEQTPLLHLLK